MDLSEVTEFFSSLNEGPLSDLILSDVPYVAEYLRKSFSTTLKLVDFKKYVSGHLEYKSANSNG